MQNLTSVLLLTQLLLLATAPDSLAADNSLSDQQPVPQYSKLPPLQFSGGPMMQKEYFQAALWLAQSSKQASTPKKDDEWLGISTTMATVLSSIAALIAAIMAPVISIYVAKRTMQQTKDSLQEDFNQRKLEQKDNFKFQLYQLALEEKKRAMLNFFESTSIPSVDSVDFSMDEIRAQMTMLEMLMDKDFYKNAHSLFTFLSNHIYDFLHRSPDDLIRQEVITNYKYLHLDLGNDIKRVLGGYDLESTFKASS